MSALTTPRTPRETTIKSKMFPLKAGVKAYQGARAYADTANAWITIGVTGNANLQPLGIFDFTVDNTAGTGTTLAQVSLDKEILVQWLDNATGTGAVTLAADLFDDCYVLDDHTVSMTNTGSNSSKAGRVWDVDATRGVAVQAYWIY